MVTPKVSIIVPVYNTRPYLPECLDSLLCQTLEDVEIICVDNGSSDSSLDLLRAYEEDHKKIKVLLHPRGRQGDARNIGLQVAQGDYFGFVDSDDFVAPTMFEALYHTAAQVDADVAICNIGLWYGRNKLVREAIPVEQLQLPSPFLISSRPKLLRNLTICNKLFASRLLNKHLLKFPEGVYHEDQFFVVMALILARSIVAVPELMYFYRKMRKGSVSTYHGKINFSIFHIMDMLFDALEGKGLLAEHAKTLDELRIARFLAVFASTKGHWQREFYARMRSEFESIEMPARPGILTPTECREFLFVRRLPLSLFRVFLAIRAIYGSLRG